MRCCGGSQGNPGGACPANAGGTAAAIAGAAGAASSGGADAANAGDACAANADADVAKAGAATTSASAISRQRSASLSFHDHRTCAVSGSALQVPTDKSSSSDHEKCAICSDSLGADCVYGALCGHGHCPECIQASFQSAISERKVPLQCGFWDCDALIAIQDVQHICTPAQWQQAVEMATAAFVQVLPRRVTPTDLACPQPGAVPGPFLRGSRKGAARGAACGEEHGGKSMGGGGTNDGPLQTRKRHQQEHWPHQLTRCSDPTQHVKGRMGDCPGPRKEIATRWNVTQGGGGASVVYGGCAWVRTGSAWFLAIRLSVWPCWPSLLLAPQGVRGGRPESLFNNSAPQGGGGPTPPTHPLSTPHPL